METHNNNRMAVTERGLKFILGGLALLVLGYVLLAGGGVQDPEVFNYDMFNWRRMVAAPIVMVAGFAVIAAAVLGAFDKGKKEKPMKKRVGSFRQVQRSPGGGSGERKGGPNAFWRAFSIM